MALRKFNLDYTRKRAIVIVLSVLLLLLVYLFKNAAFSLRAVSAIAILGFFYITDHVFDIKFRSRHYIFISLIAIFSFLLSPAYYVYPSYDKIQHVIQPMLAFSIVFYMINKLTLELKWKIIFTFFIVSAIIGFLEIGEYALDYFFSFNLQGVYLRDTKGMEKLHLLMDPLNDTMVDMIYSILGAGIYSIAFAYAMRKKLQQKIFKDY